MRAPDKTPTSIFKRGLDIMENGGVDECEVAGASKPKSNQTQCVSAQRLLNERSSRWAREMTGIGNSKLPEV